jgi:hypothetical protein
MSESLDVKAEGVMPVAGRRGAPDSLALNAPKTHGRGSVRARRTRPCTAHRAAPGPRARAREPAGGVVSGTRVASTLPPALKAAGDEGVAMDLERTARVLVALLPMLRHLACK